jgi:hypothetical protein
MLHHLELPGEAPGAEAGRGDNVDAHLHYFFCRNEQAREDKQVDLATLNTFSGH